MAVRFNATASGQYLNRASVLPASTPATIAGWCYVVGTPATGAYSDIFNFSLGTTSPTGPGASIFNNGGTIRFDLGTSATDNVGTTTPVAGTWYYVALVCTSATGRELWINGVREVNITNSEAQTQAVLGQYSTNNTAGQASGNNRLSRVRVWSAALNQAEIIAEMWSDDVVRRRDLRANWRLTTAKDLVDYGPYRADLNAGPVAVAGTEEGPYNLTMPRRRRFWAPLLALDANATGGSTANGTAASVGTAAEAATLTATAALTGASGGTGISAAALTATAALAAASTGTGTESATPGGTGALTATDAGTSRESAAAAATGALSGASVGTGTEAGASTGTGALSGKTWGTSGDSAAFAVAGSMTASSGGTSRDAGTATGAGALSGLSFAWADGAGTLSAAGTLTGKSGGTSDDAGLAQDAGTPPTTHKLSIRVGSAHRLTLAVG